MNSIKNYTCDLYEYINEYLRLRHNGNDYYDEQIENIDRCLTPSNEEQLVFRGITNEPKFGLELGYLSTTLSYDIAKMHHNS